MLPCVVAAPVTVLFVADASELTGHSCTKTMSDHRNPCSSPHIAGVPVHVTSGRPEHRTPSRVGAELVATERVEALVAVQVDRLPGADRVPTAIEPVVVPVHRTDGLRCCPCLKHTIVPVAWARGESDELRATMLFQWNR